MISARERARSSSITITGPVGSVRMSNSVMTYGFDSAAIARASRSVRRSSWSISSSGMPGGKSICLMATWRCSTSSVAAHTVPIEPLPITRSSR